MCLEEGEETEVIAKRRGRRKQLKEQIEEELQIKNQLFLNILLYVPDLFHEWPIILALFLFCDDLRALIIPTMLG